MNETHFFLYNIFYSYLRRYSSKAFYIKIPLQNKLGKEVINITKKKYINKSKANYTSENMKKSVKSKSIKEKTNFLNKKFFLIITVIIIICIIGLMWVILSSSLVKAQLIIDTGTVEVKKGEGPWVIAQNGMDLYKSDSIRTGENSSASIIFFKTSIIRLDSNTEVTLEELLKEEETSITIQQNSGRTWNSINKISGIDNYEVQTPTTIASVRGTAFVVTVWENGSTYYGVSHGILNVTSISNGAIQDSINVSSNKSVFVFIDMINESLEIVPFKIDEWVLENLLKDQQFVDDLKAELYSRIKDYIPELKTEFRINDEEIDTLLEGYILGYFDLPTDTPIWIKDLFKFY